MVPIDVLMFSELRTISYHLSEMFVLNYKYIPNKKILGEWEQSYVTGFLEIVLNPGPAMFL